jgi:hypothetical protein
MSAMEEYLTTDELCGRIKYQKQTIYNLIHRKVFVAGKHFLKPTPKKILFKWSEIQTWIGEDPGLIQKSAQAPVVMARPPGFVADTPKEKGANLIRI